MDAATKTTTAAFCAVASICLMAGALSQNVKWFSDQSAASNGASTSFSITLSGSLFNVCWAGTSSFTGSTQQQGCWTLTSNTVSDNTASFPFGSIYKTFASSIQTLASASILTVASLAVAIAFATIFVCCQALLGFKAGSFDDAAALVCMKICGFVFWVSGFAGVWIYLNGFLQTSSGE
jgi:hypothetical protein